MTTWLYLLCLVIHTERENHELINYKDTKTKCGHLKKWHVKGLNEFIDWIYSQSCWYFRPSFVESWPSNLLPGSPPLLAPTPLACVKVQYIQTVCGWEGVEGVQSCWRPYSGSVLYLTRDSEPTKLLDHRKKPMRGGDLRQINICRKVPLQVNFLDDDIMHCFLYISLIFYMENKRGGESPEGGTPLIGGLWT
jgi:hypothetical protein